MKKVLFLGFILAILLLAFPQGVTAATTGSVTVDASIADSIDFTPSVTTITWPLVFTPSPINTLDPAVTFAVTSNRPWKINVDDKDGATAGHLTPWGGSGYSGTPLFNALHVGSVNLDTAGGGIILSGEKGSSSPTTSFTQTLVDTDAAGPTYRIVLTFDIMDNGGS
jgi:hypothetical protein